MLTMSRLVRRQEIGVTFDFTPRSEWGGEAGVGDLNVATARVTFAADVRPRDWSGLSSECASFYIIPDVCGAVIRTDIFGMCTSRQNSNEAISAFRNFAVAAARISGVEGGR